MKHFALIIAGALQACAVSAQSLSPEDISRMLDEKAATPNPYAELLNDPDPQRSMGAMKIMMESGDEELVTLAKEFGLLSPNSEVRQTAVEYYLATKPLLPIVLVGQDIPGKQLEYQINVFYEGFFDSNKVGRAELQVGKYDDEKDCFLWERLKTCGLRVKSDGVYFSFEPGGGWNTHAKMDITEEGVLTGYARMFQIDEPVPMLIRLLD